MTANEPYERRVLTDDDLEADRKALEQFYRDFAAAKDRPPAEIRNPGKVSEPLGKLPDGTFQPPLTEQEKRHNKDVRRRAQGEADS